MPRGVAVSDGAEVASGVNGQKDRRTGQQDRDDASRPDGHDRKTVRDEAAALDALTRGYA
jgi:hypothetical protein